MILIQIGGLGVIAIMSGLMILLHKKMGIGDRLLLQDAFNLNSLSGLVRFVKKVVGGTLVGLPVMLTFVNLICIIATSADPRRKNISNKMFSVVISIVPVCSLLCGACIYGNALGYKVSVESIMPVFMGILFFVHGFILPKCKQNYTIGIKLPWTLHDEENWDKTHKLAGKLWIYGGIIMVVSGLFNLTFLFMAIIFALVIIPTVYSYLLYRKQK